MLLHYIPNSSMLLYYIPNSSILLHYILFAVDSNVLFSHTSYGKLLSILNSASDRIKDNKLSLNLSKTRPNYIN